MPAAVLAVIAPVFIVIAVGWLSARTGYVAAGTTQVLGGFVLRLALPALVFTALTAGPDRRLDYGYMLAYAAATFATFAIGLLLARRAGKPLSEGVVWGLGMSGTNSGFMGYPIAALVVGPAAATVLAQNMVVENLLLLPFAMVLGDSSRGARGTLGATLRGIAGNLLTNPLLLAIAAGLAVAGLGITLPAPLAKPVTLIGSVAGPLALFVVGATMAELGRGGTRGQILAIVAGKLVLHPLLMLLALLLVPGLDPAQRAGGIIFCAAPMMSIYAILGARFGRPGLSAAALLAATVASALTMPVLIALLDRVGWVTIG